jgi:hypothetical protein
VSVRGRSRGLPTLTGWAAARAERLIEIQNRDVIERGMQIAKAALKNKGDFLQLLTGNQYD